MSASRPSVFIAVPGAVLPDHAHVGTSSLDRAELPEFALDEPVADAPPDAASDVQRAAANANALLGTSFGEGSEDRYVYLDDVARTRAAAND